MTEISNKDIFLKHRRKRKKLVPKQPTFNCYRYANTFDFCSREEILRLSIFLKKSWSWAYPPTEQEMYEQSHGKMIDAESFDTPERVEAKLREYELYRLHKKIKEKNCKRPAINKSSAMNFKKYETILFLCEHYNYIFNDSYPNTLFYDAETARSEKEYFYKCQYGFSFEPCTVQTV